MRSTNILLTLLWVGSLYPAQPLRANLGFNPQALHAAQGASSLIDPFSEMKNSWLPSQQSDIELLESSQTSRRMQTEFEGAFIRWAHAKELLGKLYAHSVVAAGESVQQLDSRVYEWTQRGLHRPWKKQSRKIAQAILAASVKYKFDPIFLIAVIENESSFNPAAIGPVGELGLMQLTLKTGEWIAKKYHLPWDGEKTLKDPVQNIALGSAYLSHLRSRFPTKSQLYISAYNMGSHNVRQLARQKIEPKAYAGRVMLRYVRFYAELQLALSKPEGNGMNQSLNQERCRL